MIFNVRVYHNEHDVRSIKIQAEKPGLWAWRIRGQYTVEGKKPSEGQKKRTAGYGTSDSLSQSK